MGFKKRLAELKEPDENTLLNNVGSFVLQGLGHVAKIIPVVGTHIGNKFIKGGKEVTQPTKAQIASYNNMKEFLEKRVKNNEAHRQYMLRARRQIERDSIAKALEKRREQYKARLERMKDPHGMRKYGLDIDLYNEGKEARRKGITMFPKSMPDEATVRFASRGMAKPVLSDDEEKKLGQAMETADKVPYTREEQKDMLLEDYKSKWHRKKNWGQGYKQ